jgi:hypothetical protein
MSDLVGPEFATPAELRDYIKSAADLPDAQASRHLRTAEALVAAWLGYEQLAYGGLGVRQRLETQIVPRHQVALIELEGGPLTSIVPNLNSLKVDGTAFDLTLLKLVRGWGLKRLDGNCFPWTAKLELDYLEGYAIDSGGVTTMPQQVRDAILITAADGFDNPIEGKVSERIGDWAAKRAGGEAAAEGRDFRIPERAQLLLRDHRRPRM